MQRTFTQLFSATPHGARQARLLVANRMHVWGFARRSETSDAVTLVAAELAANAVRHGRVRGRGFRVRLLLEGDVVRVEVLDARVERLPLRAQGELDEGGRGLLMVEALAGKWGVELRPGGVHKTVWADVPLS
ncbi:ATP-binding protein [Streptomyces sp. NPDC017958]|uniref:ATP-binding protein n=1 Tax=Streptomyces sp. NPDC017958 TaxID=3365021 RepID=UPI0037A46418